MAEADGTARSWWGTMPGILTALAGTITALGGLVAVLSQSGLIGAKPAPPVAAADSPGASLSRGVAPAEATQAPPTGPGPAPPPREGLL